MLDQVAAGNPTALPHLLALHRPFLKRVIEMRMEPALRSRVDASDVAQEAQLMINKGIERRQTTPNVISDLGPAKSP